MGEFDSFSQVSVQVVKEMIKPAQAMDVTFLVVPRAVAVTRIGKWRKAESGAESRAESSVNKGGQRSHTAEGTYSPSKGVS